MVTAIESGYSTGSGAIFWRLGNIQSGGKPVENLLVAQEAKPVPVLFQFPPPPTYSSSPISRSELLVSNNIVAAPFFQLFPLDTLLFSVTDISFIVRLCHSFPLAASQHPIFDLTSRPVP